MFSYEFLKIFSSRGLRPLQALVPLLAARRAQRVNDEAVKILNMLFFVYFIWKWGETLEKAAFFHFLTKAILLLNPFSPGILWKSGIFKKTEHATLNGCISKARTNSELKLTFSESSFNFLLKQSCFLDALPTWVHGRGLCPLQPPGPLPTVRRTQRVKNK